STMWSPAERDVILLRAIRYVTSVKPATTPEPSGTAATCSQTSVPSGRLTLSRTARTGCPVLRAAITGWTVMGPSPESTTSQSECSALERTTSLRSAPRSAHAAVEALIRRTFDFLLGRTPASSILRESDLAVIQRYFPEYARLFAR